MAGNYKRRKRSVDIEKFTPEQADATANQLSSEVNKIMTAAYSECNKLLNIFKMKLEMGYEITKLEKKEKPSKKKDKLQSLK